MLFHLWINSEKFHLSAVEKAECLNLSFAKQCSAPSPISSSHPAPPCSNLTKFYFGPMTASAVLKRLSSLDTIKALGLGGVSNRLLKECPSVLAEPLTHIFNVSFEKFCFPHRLAEDLKSLGTWAVDWCTTFNASKSAHILIQQCPHDNSPSLMLSSTMVPLVSTTEHLGVCLTDRLSWSAHIAHLVQRVNFHDQVYTLKRLSFHVGTA